MSLVKKITKAVAGNPLDNAEKALNAARENLELRQAELASTEASVEAERSARQDALAAGADDVELDRLDAAVVRAKHLVARARERLEIGQQLLEKTEATHVAEKLRADSEKAEAISKAESDRVPGEYAAFAQTGIQMILRLAESREAIKALGSSRNPEESRFPDWQAETIVSERVAELWATLRGGVVLEPQPRDSQIEVDKDGFSFIQDGPYNRQYVRRRRFRVVSLREGTRSRYVEPLSAGISLPGLYQGADPLWRPEDGKGDSDLVLMRARRALERLEKQIRELRERRDNRDVVTRYDPIDDGSEPAAGNGDIQDPAA